MIRGRLEQAGELVAWHLAGVLAMVGEKAKPHEINPYRVAKPKSAELLRIEAWQQKMRWRVMVEENAKKHAGNRG